MASICLYVTRAWLPGSLGHLGWRLTTGCSWDGTSRPCGCEGDLPSELFNQQWRGHADRYGTERATHLPGTSGGGGKPSANDQANQHRYGEGQWSRLTGQAPWPATHSADCSDELQTINSEAAKEPPQRVLPRRHGGSAC
jgi:hypothetical protein